MAEIVFVSIDKNKPKTGLPYDTFEATVGYHLINTSINEHGEADVNFGNLYPLDPALATAIFNVHGARVEKIELHDTVGKTDIADLKERYEKQFANEAGMVTVIIWSYLLTEEAEE